MIPASFRCAVGVAVVASLLAGSLAATNLSAGREAGSSACLDTAENSTAWLLYDGDAPVGHVLRKVDVVNGSVVTNESMQVFVRHRGARRAMSFDAQWVESCAGVPVRWKRTVAGGTVASTLSVDVLADRLRVERRTGSVRSSEDAASSTELVFPGRLATRLHAVRAAGEETVHLTSLDAATGTIADSVLRIPAGPDSGAIELVGTVSTGEATRRTRVYWFPAQRAVIPVISIMGIPLEPRLCADDCTTEGIEGLELVAPITLASPFRIPRDAARRPIRYVLVDGSAVAPDLPHSVEQQVVVRGNRAIVTVCPACDGEDVLADVDRDRYLAANAWVQSDHPRIRKLARAARAGSGSVGARMRRLTAHVQRYLSEPIDYLGYASALDALHGRGGDCTEFALLLAALARSEGIPTRVVAGAAYASRFTGMSDVFSPHMWVQAWTGTRWQSFDAGLGDFGSTHIALAIGDGHPSQFETVAGQLRHLEIVTAAAIAD